MLSQIATDCKFSIRDKGAVHMGICAHMNVSNKGSALQDSHSPVSQ